MKILNLYNQNKTTKLIFISLLSLFLNLESFGQNNKLSLSIQYFPNISNITSKVEFGKNKLSQIGLVELEYEITKNILPAIGIGFMSTGDRFESSVIRQVGNTNIKSRVNYNYVIVPIGIKLKLGTMFLKPEIGFAYYISNTFKTKSIDENGIKTKEKSEVLHQGDVAFKKLTIPVFLTVGKEFTLNETTFKTGIKGYYGLDPILTFTTPNSVKNKYNRYIGLGIFIGMKI